MSIHCPILVSLSRLFVLKKKSDVSLLLITDLCMYLTRFKVDAFFSTQKPGPNSSLVKNDPILIDDF